MQKPTDSELEILQILWAKGACTVRDVFSELEQKKPIVYTTILKTMQIMLEKGIVLREESNKAHTYKAAISQENTQQHFIDKMVDTLFSGSISNLVMQALGNRKSSKEELDAIKAYLEELESPKN